MLHDFEKNAIRDHYRAIAENLPNFRPRTAQREMMAAIAHAFSRTLESDDGEPVQREGESIVVIEGPTGVGKSLAYLLAGGIMAQARGKRLIVSSATIALQEQLIERDLPFVVEKSGLDLSFALAKGRGRYLCPYKLYQLTQNPSQRHLEGIETSEILWNEKPKKEDLETLKNMAQHFSARTFNGDRDAWHEKIEDSLWSKITNDRHGCLKSHCPNRPECPFFLARDVLENVDVIVANHDLLLSDISMGGGVILPDPAHAFYCIDEAHHLAKKALNHFAAEHSLTLSLTLLEKLPDYAKSLAHHGIKPELMEALGGAVADSLQYLVEWQFHLKNAPELKTQHEGRDHENTWLWQDGIAPEYLSILTNNTFISTQNLLKHVYAVQDSLNTTRREQDSNAAVLDIILGKWGETVARTEQIAAVWALMASAPKNEHDPPLAKWITQTRNEKGKTDWLFNASPISSATMLTNQLWRRAAGALLTSATLQSLGSFQFLLKQTGLIWLPEVKTLALKSPFDFYAQGELYLPAIVASPKDPAAHTDEIAQWLPKLIDAQAPIGTLVLFTSRKQMQDVSLRLPEEYLPLILMQGEQSKSRLLEQHYAAIKAGKASIIFGLDSFAEGLDLPGEACVHVIIAKLPFAMPENPIEKTQSRWIEQRGGRPFLEITVPEASIKLIQAVGRLIRTEQDYGRVSILDNRIRTAAYGQQLLSNLPPFRRIG